MKTDLLPIETGPTDITVTTNNPANLMVHKDGEQALINEELRKANRLYAFISAINRSIVHIKSQQELLDRVCKIAAEIGQYKMARIGLLDENGQLQMFCSVADGATTWPLDNYSKVDFTIPALQNSVTARMLRTGKYVSVNDAQNDFNHIDWKEEVARLQLRSIISLPIKKFGKIAGSFTLGSGQQNLFDETEIGLLEETAGDIGYALENFEQEEKRKLAEALVLQKQAQFNNAQSIAHLGHWELDFSNGVAVWSEEACRIYGLDPADNRQSFDVWISFLHTDDLGYVMGLINEQRKSLSSNAFDHRIVRRDGTVRYIHSESQFIFGASGQPIGLYGISLDITAQKLAEEKIRENEERYRQIVETSREGIWLIDENNKTVFVNKRFTEIFGYTFDEMMGKSNFDLMDEEGKAIAKEKMERRKHGIAEEFELIYVTKSGKKIWTNVSASPIKDDNGMYVGGLAMITDINDRKEAEQELKRNEANLRESQQIAHVGSWDIDFSTNTQNWSDELYNIYGLKKEEVSPSTELFLSCVHPDDLAFVSSEVEKAYNNLSECIFTFRAISKSGITKYCYSETKFEFDSNHKPVRLYGIVQDITARKTAEEELRRNEAKLKDAQAIAHMGSWEIDMVNSTLHWSDEQFRLLGYEPGEVEASSEMLLNMVHPEDADEVYKNYAHAFRVFENSSKSFRLLLRDGSVKHVFCEWKFEFDDKLQPIRIYGITHDITEVKKAEEEIKALNENLESRITERTAELTVANKALEAFSYSVSHDLRAPVRAVLGFTKIIQKEYSAGFSDDMKELFGHIEDSSKRMNAIIDDLLRLAKYEKEPLKVAPVDMNALFSRVWDNIQFASPHKANLKIGKMPKVTADVSMLEQVVVNLVSNAVKYSSKKEKPQITIGCTQSYGMINFYVKDNGAGFDMKNYDRLFGAFQRLHGTSDFEGTGVGLVLVKRIVERHGGIVWAEGKVDEGAVFYFTLPLAI